MSVTLPTLDEIEAYWAAHPEGYAITCDETSCVIAMPLHERYPEALLSVIPRRIGEFGRITGTGIVNALPSAASIVADQIQVPLPEDLNYLAKEFDRMAGIPDDDGDSDGFAFNEHQSISAEECLMLIRRVKEETKV